MFLLHIIIIAAINVKLPNTFIAPIHIHIYNYIVTYHEDCEDYGGNYQVVNWEGTEHDVEIAAAVVRVSVCVCVGMLCVYVCMCECM